MRCRMSAGVWECGCQFEGLVHVFSSTRPRRLAPVALAPVQNWQRPAARRPVLPTKGLCGARTQRQCGVQGKRAAQDSMAHMGTRPTPRHGLALPLQPQLQLNNPTSQHPRCIPQPLPLRAPPGPQRPHPTPRPGHPRARPARTWPPARARSCLARVKMGVAEEVRRGGAGWGMARQREGRLSGWEGKDR